MSELDAYENPPGYGDMIGKCLTFAEIEALLAAERERCAAVADALAEEAERVVKVYAGYKYEDHHKGRASASRRAAALIRRLLPQPEEGQP